MDLTEKYLEYGLVDVQQLDSTIIVELKYSTADNFMHRPMYDGVSGAFLEKDLAQAIVGAQKTLKAIEETLSIIIYDAARPISVQRMMYDSVKGTAQERYVANPYVANVGGFHNYGLAVDMAIVDASGKMLDFGTGYDSFSELAHADCDLDFAIEGKLSREAYANRQLLYYVTAKQGLLPYKFEWWHYQLCQREEDKANYKLLDF